LPIRQSTASTPGRSSLSVCGLATSARRTPRAE
jgi:hypothetical protein